MHLSFSFPSILPFMMTDISSFSPEEEDILRKGAREWADAATSIARNNIADKACTQIIGEREKTLKIKVSPRERQKLFEVSICGAL
jgi:hypothetical protein